MSLDSFNCQPGGLNPCYHGTCTVHPTTGSQSCLCTDGWDHDNSLWHDKSCLLPPNTYVGALAVLTVVTSLSTAVVAWVWLRSKKVVRLLAMTTTTFILANYMVGVGWYVQNGMFEMAAVALQCSRFFGLLHIYVVAQRSILDILVKVKAGDDRDAMERFFTSFRFLFGGFVLGDVGMTAASLVVIRDAAYNSVVVAQSLYLAAFVAVMGSVVRKFFRELADSIDSSMQVSPNPDILRGVKDRLASNARQMIHVTIGIAMQTVANVIVFFILGGSFPVSFVFIIPSTCINPVQLVYGLASLVYSRGPSSSSAAAVAVAATMSTSKPQSGTTGAVISSGGGGGGIGGVDDCTS